jgi:hypothetical protein
MRQLGVSDHDLLHLFEMCLDAEERCHTLREQGAHERAAYAAQMRDKYAYLKARIFQAMREMILHARRCPISWTSYPGFVSVLRTRPTRRPDVGHA